MKSMEREDEILKSFFKENIPLPESDITSSVMKQIDLSSKKFQYQPIIGSKMWALIAVVFMALMLLALPTSNGVLLKTPSFILKIGSAFSGLINAISLSGISLHIPNVSPTFVVTLASFNIIGVYLMVSYRWSSWMFRS